jgi:Tfp pilus assembly protein PilN
MRAVNLLPPDASARKSFRSEDPAVVVGSALGVIVLIALGAGFMSVHAKVGSEQKKLDAARTQLAQLSLVKPTGVSPQRHVAQRPIVPVPPVTSEEQPRLAAITTAMSSRIAWDRILREFSLVLPSDVTVTALTLAAPAAPALAGSPATAAPAMQGLSLTGTATSNDGVARLLTRLMLIPDLTNVTLANSSAMQAAGSPGGVQFSISAEVRGAVAPPIVADTVPTGATS